MGLKTRRERVRKGLGKETEWLGLDSMVKEEFLFGSHGSVVKRYTDQASMGIKFWVCSGLVGKRDLVLVVYMVIKDYFQIGLEKNKD